MGSETAHRVIWARTISRQNVQAYWSEIYQLYADSPLGQQVNNSRLLTNYIRLPIQHAQMRIYGLEDQVQAVATWACLSDIEARRYELTQEAHHWNCGEQIYVIDVIGNKINMFKVIRELRSYGFKRYGQTHFNWFRQDYVQNRSRKGWC
jgi:hemolysin-activating ACP:hemolysin acyltransferase